MENKMKMRTFFILLIVSTLLLAPVFGYVFLGSVFSAESPSTDSSTDKNAEEGDPNKVLLEQLEKLVVDFPLNYLAEKGKEIVGKIVGYRIGLDKNRFEMAVIVKVKGKTSVFYPNKIKAITSADD